MAAVTVLGSLFDTTTGTHTVTATPAVGDVIVIVAMDSGYTGVVTPTDNNSSGVYTLVVSALKNTSADIAAIFVRTQKITTASSTIFSHAAAASTGGGMIVYAVSGLNNYGIGAIRQSASQANQAAAGTPTPVFAKAVLTTNIVIGGVFNGTNPAGMTPPATPTYTEDVDTGYITPTTGAETVHVVTGETRSSIPWGGTSASAFSSVIAEISVEVATGNEDWNTIAQPTTHYSPTYISV